MAQKGLVARRPERSTEFGKQSTFRLGSNQSSSVSKTDQQHSSYFRIIEIGHVVFEQEEIMLGYGLAGTIVVILVVVFIVRAL